VAEVVREVLDVARQGLADSQPVERQQRHQRRRARPVSFGGRQQFDQFGLVEAYRR